MRSQAQEQAKIRHDFVYGPAPAAILQQAADRRMRLHCVGLVLLALAMSSCTSGPTMVVQPAPLATLTITPNSTEIVWFPATNTALPPQIETHEPTPEKRPGLGQLVFMDDMTSSTHWNAATGGEAAATISDKGLTISAQPGVPGVVSLHRSAAVDDMYIEVVARTNLCRGRDSFGLVFRAPNDVAHYRFAAVCDGTAAALRFSLGGPRVLQPPVASSDVPLGAPGEVTLGVWALGSEFRFFLNDRYQFTVNDSNYAAGGVGVFVEAGGQTPAVVTFSDLAVYLLSPDASSGTPAP